MIVFWGLMLAWSLSNLFDAQENVRIAEEDHKNAVTEYEQAQREVDAIIDEHLAGAWQ